MGIVLHALAWRVRVVEDNLNIAFPGLERAAHRQRLRRAAYAHLGHLVFEVALVLGPLRSFVRRYSELRGLAYWREARASGKGVIFLSSHIGNWELMAAAGGLAGIDLMLVTKRLKPEWFHRAIAAGRATCGVRATYEPRTLKDVLACLKKGETVGFVLDQYAGPPVGVRVPVFGQPVGTNTVVASIAKRTGAAVLPVLNYRDGNKHIVEIQKPLDWVSDPIPAKEIAVNTAQYAKLLEGHILAHPEQWLWIHRRFKGDLSPLRENEWAEGRARS
jgi:KDO2-lipid IV(A) lauroyltransferase